MGIFLTVTLKSSGMQRVFKQNKEMSITGMEWAREECTKNEVRGNESEC